MTPVRLPALFIFIAFFISCNPAPGTFPDIPPPKTAPDPHPSFDYLSPEESMKKIRLPEGYHLELVAAEPVVEEPVAMVWDGEGRLYVAEMRSYMRDIDATGEQLPIGRITMLSDTDGDGKMDKHSIFIDSLVLPRMMLMLGDQLVVNETNSRNLFGYRDTNGDGRADEKKLLYENNEPDEANLEHQRSGLVWNIDNYIYTTRSPLRFRFGNGMLKADTIYSTDGQWGLAHDDYGRMFFSSAGGEIPAHDFQQAPEYGRLGITNELENNFEAVWPITATPDVEGGKLRLREDSTLNHFTSSCGQTIYRGDRLPPSLKGDLFICEPAGRLIRRAKVIDRNGTIFLRNAYDSVEFIGSSDMNFRPVNLETGPDGCLYIADMYHGIIQEGSWTREGSYLRQQILHRNLDKHINRGRIYRVVYDGIKPGPAPHLLQADNQNLIAYLSHPNGWWRDNAQRLLVMKNDPSIIPALENIKDDLGRLHALWTIDGLHKINKQMLLRAFADKNPQIRKAAIKLSEPFLQKNEDEDIWPAFNQLKNDTSADVRVQLALSMRYSRNKNADEILKYLLSNNKTELMHKVVAESRQEEDPALKELRKATAGMDEEDKNLVITGAKEFHQLCTTCHGGDGKGLPSGIAPPLAGSARVNGDKDILVRILLNGLSGPVDNKSYPGTMLSLATNNDEYIAAVASYIRNSMGNEAKVILPEDVQKIREQTAARKTPWTLKELSRFDHKK